MGSADTVCAEPQMASSESSFNDADPVVGRVREQERFMGIPLGRTGPSSPMAYDNPPFVACATHGQSLMTHT